jgi:acetyl-CoA carboxylase carboxyl transferase subunit alpha
MISYYLDFEKPIKDLDTQILELESSKDPNQVNMKKLNKLKAKRIVEIENIYSRLSRWQRVQLARHPNRPYSLDYINYFSPDFIELHGDRHFMDDPAVVAGLGHFGDQKVAWIGQQKGRNTKENLYRNFGMMRPEGYRKARRVMKLAEKFGLPVITFMDTIGAYPGIGAEERGQGEAIARNLLEMSGLRVPIISVVIGEGASGGALGIGVCDRMLMLENTWYSVISPEGCASILFRDAKRAEDAAEALKPTPNDLVEIGICNRIIKEPNGGAHRDFNASANELKTALQEELNELSIINPDDFLDNRIEKYDKLGYFQESK